VTQPRSRHSFLHEIARMAIAAPRRVIAIAALVTIAAAIVGIPVAKTLCACGFEDPTSESARATALLADTFGQGDAQMIFVVSDPAGYGSDAARATGLDIVDQLKRSSHVTTVASAWTAPPEARAGLISRDRRSGLIVAGVSGDGTAAQANAKALSDLLAHDRDGVTVRSGGAAMLDVQITEQSRHDLMVMESLAIPLSFVVLVWVFGGLLAAAVPIVVGAMAVLGALAVLRGVTFFTDVSIFALNLSAALGLALAIDYTLLMISRYRDELADGAPRDEALMRTMGTAGRTVLFSATIVALSMAMMALFPMHFLKSFAYAGVATVAFAAVAALVVTPAVIVVLGERLDALKIRGPFRRSTAAHRPVAPPFLYRWTKAVMRHAVPIAVAVVGVMLLLGTPFLGVKWGFPDDRVLPSSASAHRVGDQLRDEFVDDAATAITVVVPEATDISPGDFARYAADLARVPDVTTVTPPTQGDGSAFLTVFSSAPLFSDRSQAQLDGLHAVTGPGGHDVLLTGTAQINADSVHAITSRLPLVLGLIAAIMFVVLFLLTGSVAIPLKALLLNALSLTAAFGAMVWIFQDGHLGGLGTTSTGTLVANIPVLLFCIAFGLSMDYEVFLVSRIREFWLTSGGTDGARTEGTAQERSDESVALGISRTGRVVTAAAVVMSISFAALIAAEVSFMRMFGLGLTLAVLADATLVRMVLMPAFMRVLGEWNWWAPRRLARLHDRFGLDDGDATAVSRPTNHPGATTVASSGLHTREPFGPGCRI